MIPSVRAEVNNQQESKQELIKSVVFSLDSSQYYINGNLAGNKMDAIPFIDNGRFYVPVRFLSNSLGINNQNISWDPGEGMVSIASQEMKIDLHVGSRVIVKKGISESIEVAPLIKYPGRVFIPARFVAEAFGYQVKWYKDKYMILWPKNQSEPDVFNMVKHIYFDDLTIGANEDSEFPIPAETNLNIDISKDYVIVLIRLYLPLEPQYEDLKEFLGNKFDQELVDEVIDHVKKKKNWREDLPLKKWQASKYYLKAISTSGSDWIDIRVIKI
jgi:hypothetical protein